jgi:hypothetical protein
MDMNLPSITELGQMEFMSPLANQQAQRQIDLATQFKNQNLDIGAQDLQTKTLNNMFQVQNDPLKLEEMRLKNSGTSADNIIKDINAQQRQALAPEELEAKRAKLVKEWSDSKLEKAMNDAQEMVWSGDPEKVEKGKSLYANSFKELSARMKAKDELAKQESENASRERVGAANNATAKEVAGIYAGSREKVAEVRAGGGASNIWTALQSGKMTPDKAAISAYALAQIEQDPAEAEKLLQIAATAEKMMMNKAQAGADARAAGQVDITGATKGRVPVQGRQLTPAVVPGSRGVSGPVSNDVSFDLGPNNSRVQGIRDTISKWPDSPEKTGALAQLEMQVRQSQKPAAQAPANQKPISSVADLKAMSPAYSNIPDAKLRELYKKKTGVDLK